MLAAAAAANATQAAAAGPAYAWKRREARSHGWSQTVSALKSMATQGSEARGPAAADPSSAVSPEELPPGIEP